MSQELSLPHLLGCLSDKERYKGTQLYLLQILRLNQQIYPLIDASITQTLLKPTTTSMGRLLTLRFFKEILMTANMSLIDGLNEKIEEHIIEVAQYNKKSKEVNRGANYFSDVFKAKNDAQMQKISSSYVLLALEIVTAMGKWYTKDQDGQQSRFVHYYRELSEKGVVFPSQKELNFFKKDDQQKFKRNYGKWYQNYLKYNEENKENKEKQQEQVKIKIEEPKKAEEQFNNKLQKSRQISVKQQSSQIENLKIQIASYKKTIEENDKAAMILQQKLIQQQTKNSILQANIKEQKEQIVSLEQQLKIANQLKLKKQQENYQLNIHPPHSNNDLLKRIDDLEDSLKTTTDKLNIQKTELKHQVAQLQSQKKQLKQKLQNYQIQNLQLKSQWQNSQKQQLSIIQNLQKENRLLQQQKVISKVQASFVILDEPKVGTKQMQQKQMITIKEEILQSRRQIFKDHSNVNNLRDRLDLICEKDSICQTGHKRQVSRSLKKTQSQHKLNMNRTSTNPQGFKKTNNQSKLLKTTQSFKHKNQGSKIITIFPFINNYFPILPKDCNKFKLHCLNLIEPNTPFYQNQWIKVTLCKVSLQKCIVQIYNKTNSDQKIKVMPTHPSFYLQGQKVKKVMPYTAAQYQFKIGSLDLNMRCPLISIILGNHGISLTNSVNQKIFHIPLPFTLLDLFKIKKSNKTFRLGQKTVKFGVNRFCLALNLPSIQYCLPALSCQFENGETIRVGEIEWQGSLLKLQITQWSRQVSLCVQFVDECQEIMSLGKVLLQILMYLLQD